MKLEAVTVWGWLAVAGVTRCQTGPAPLAANKPLRVACGADVSARSDAERALSREDYGKALELFKVLSSSDADASRAGVIRVLIEQNKVDDALAQAQDWAGQEPSSSAAIEALSEAQYRAASVTTALRTVQQALSLDPCNARAHLMVGKIADLAGDHAKARSRFITAHKLSPNDLDIRFAWIGTLPRSQREHEYKALAKEPDLLNEADRSQLDDNLAHSQNFKPDDCKLVEPVASATIPIREMTDGPQKWGPAGLEVQFNGKTRMLEIDTGASGILLSRESAARLHLVHEQETQVQGVGDHGAVASALAHVASIEIGGLEFRNCVVEVSEKAAAPDAGIDLIGADFFAHYLVTFDFPAMKLRLDQLQQRPEQDATGSEKLEAADLDAGEEPAHDRYLAPEMKNWTRVFRVYHDLLIPVSIGGTKDRLFLLDTGAGSTSISPVAAREVSKVTRDRDRPIVGISGKVDEVYATGKVTVAFSQVTMTLSRLPSFDMTKISHSAGVELSGFVGQTLLYRGVLHIDYRDNLVKFDYEELKDPCIHPNMLHYRSDVQMAPDSSPQVFLPACVN